MKTEKEIKDKLTYYEGMLAAVKLVILLIQLRVS